MNFFKNFVSQKKYKIIGIAAISGTLYSLGVNEEFAAKIALSISGII